MSFGYFISNQIKSKQFVKFKERFIDISKRLGLQTNGSSVKRSEEKSNENYLV
jgi:hypothetical protein